MVNAHAHVHMVACILARAGRTGWWQNPRCLDRDLIGKKQKEQMARSPVFTWLISKFLSQSLKLCLMDTFADGEFLEARQ